MTEQERQFADLTLRWTRELSAVAAEHRERVAVIETRRLDSLAALPGAKPVITAFESETLKAVATRDEAIRKAEQVRTAKEHDLDLGASAQIDDSAHDAHESDLTALADREEAVRTAAERRDARIAEIRKLPLTQQAVLLHDAEAVYASAVASARTDYNHELLQSHGAMQAKQRRAQDAARAGRERASAEYSLAKQVAIDTCAAEIASAAARRLKALGALPGAAAVNADFTGERAALDAERIRREVDLLAAFRRDRAALGLPARVAPPDAAGAFVLRRP